LTSTWKWIAHLEAAVEGALLVADNNLLNEAVSLPDAFAADALSSLLVMLAPFSPQSNLRRARDIRDAFLEKPTRADCRNAAKRSLFLFL